MYDSKFNQIDGVRIMLGNNVIDCLEVSSQDRLKEETYLLQLWCNYTKKTFITFTGDFSTQIQ